MSRIRKPVTPYLQGGHPLNRGLIGAWLMTEGGGWNVYDYSGNNYLGKFSGGSAWMAGRAGPALFMGPPHVVLPTITAFNINKFTFSVWVNLSTLFVDYPAIVHVNDPAIAGASNPYGLYAEAGAGIVLVKNNAATLWIPVASLPFGKWLHIVGTYDGTTPKLYLNGVDSGAAHSDNGYPATTPNAIGIGYFEQQWVGPIDDIRIYNRHLTQAEVLALYQTTYAEFTPNFRAKLKRVKAASPSTFLPAWATGCNQTFGGQASP